MKMAEAADSYRHVDLLNIMAIFQMVADRTNRPDIGLELGQSVDLAQLGVFGFMYMNASTVGTALADFVRFGPVFQTQAHFGLKRGKRRIRVEYSSNHPEMPGWEIDSEVTVAYIMGIVNKLAGRRINPDEIQMDHLPICDSSDYLKHLSVRPSFGRSMNRLYYSHTLLNEPIRGADPLLYAVLLRHLSDLANSMPKENDLIDVVRNNIRRGIGTNTATLEHIASEVGVEPRTLQRRLVKSGTSFQKLFDKVRLDLALYYLDRTSLDVTQIAFELGYAEASVFSRAFKRWTGVAPGPYRKMTAP
jgi:AraC-like DNA-binding protein